MSVIRHQLPPFIGGDEIAYAILILQDGVPLDLTGYEISAEIEWDDCTQIRLTTGSGIEINSLAPPEVEAGAEYEHHFTLRLTEEQTRCIPEGRRAILKIIRVSSEGFTIIRGPIYMERSL